MRTSWLLLLSERSSVRRTAEPHMDNLVRENYGDSARRVGRRIREVAERRRVADQPEVPVRIEEAALPVRPPRRFVVPYGIAAAVRARLDSPRDEAVGVVDETSTRTVVVPMSVGL